MSPNWTSLINVVEAVEEAKRRLPDTTQTYFSLYDLWLYHAVYDRVLCPVCRELAYTQAEPSIWSGLHIRKFFPDMDVVGPNRIDVKVHPNCRCWLERIVDPQKYVDAVDQLRLE